MKVLIIFSLVSTHSFLVITTPARESKELLPNLDREILFGLSYGESDTDREEKSLLNTFPFNQDENHHTHEEGEEHEHEHEHEHHHHEEGTIQSSPVQREQTRPRFPFTNIPRDNVNLIGAEDEIPVSINDFTQEGSTSTDNDEESLEEDESESGDQNAVGFNEIAGSGRKCIDKVMMVTETVYDEVVTCDHSYSSRCHTSYVTEYTSQQEEECQENFKKSCYIEYSPVASQETVEKCITPVVKDCQEGE